MNFVHTGTLLIRKTKDYENPHHYHSNLLHLWNNTTNLVTDTVGSDGNIRPMTCDKEGYSKKHAEQLKTNIYKKARRTKKLRVYFCPECHLYHLSSSIQSIK